MTLPELQADMELIELALARAKHVVVGLDQIEDARGLREKPVWSGLRGLLEQAMDAQARVAARIRPPISDEPCIPPGAFSSP